MACLKPENVVWNYSMAMMCSMTMFLRARR